MIYAGNLRSAGPMTRSINSVILVVLLAAMPGAIAQQSKATEAASSESEDVTEEIVVIGQSPARLRVQIELAEEAVYDRFNAINSDDEFDIHCRREVLTGTRIPQRVCQANFWRNAQSDAAAETVRALQGFSSTNAAVFQGEAFYKTRLLEDEMRTLAANDEELLAAIARLAGLTESLRASRGRNRRDNRTSARVAPDATQELPYDAAVLADVTIGRDPWEHVLTHRTFAIAHVFGEIDSIRLNCGDATTELSFEVGAEWRVPDDWTPCFVRVEAKRDTTFSFFEFE